MSNATCVGGLVLSNNRYVRLLNHGNYYQPTDTDFEIGAIWEIKFIDRPNLHPPHVEDVVILEKRFLKKVENIPELIKERKTIDWNGHIDNLFGGTLHWTNSGAGYIPIGGQMPGKSVGFWLADM